MAENTTGIDDVVRGAGSVEKRTDAEELGSSKFWQMEIQASSDRERHWRRKVKSTIELYRDDRGSDTWTSAGFNVPHSRMPYPYRFNILWSNTEILKASLYGTSPAPDVRRRWRTGKSDQEQKVAREAADMLERALTTQLDSYEYDCESKAAVEDFVLPGRGVLRVNYEPMFNDAEDAIIRQDFTHSYVFWDDFRTSAGRRWQDKWWIAFRHEMSRDDLTDLLKKPGANSKANANEIPLNVTVVTEKGDKPQTTRDTFKKAEVWEIWDKDKRERTWIACDYDPILLKEDDPYQLQEFFPAPEPITYVSTNDRYEPVVPFDEYQDQALELDQVTTRLRLLTQALKYRGIYDGSADGNKDAFANLGNVGDNEFVPHKNVAALLEKGGLSAAFLVMPLAELIAVIDKLTERRTVLINEIMEITGISDIIRASSDPREKLGTQELKANFANLRTRNPQEQVNEQQKQVIRLLAELMAEHMQPDILMDMAGMQLPTRQEQIIARFQAAQVEQFNAQIQANQEQAQAMGLQPQEPPEVPEVTIDDVMQLLRSDRTRSFRIGIETSVTGLQDQSKERQDRMELTNTLRELLTEAIPAMQANPTIRPLLKEMVLFTVRGFEQGRQLEDALEDTFDAIENMPPPQEQDTDDGTVQVAMADVQRRAQKDQADAQLDQAELQRKREKDAQDAALKARDLDIKEQDNVADQDITRQDNLADQELEAIKIAAEFEKPEGEFGVRTVQ